MTDTQLEPVVAQTSHSSSPSFVSKVGLALSRYSAVATAALLAYVLAMVLGISFHWLPRAALIAIGMLWVFNPVVSLVGAIMLAFGRRSLRLPFFVYPSLAINLVFVYLAYRILTGQSF